MFLTSNTNVLSSNTQAMKSLVFGVSGRGRYVEVHQVDPQHGGFSWGEVTTAYCRPQGPKTVCSRRFTRLAVRGRTTYRLPSARPRGVWRLKVVPFKTYPLTQLQGADKNQRASTVEPGHCLARLSQDLWHQSCSHRQKQRNEENPEKERARISMSDWV